MDKEAIKRRVTRLLAVHLGIGEARINQDYAMTLSARGADSVDHEEIRQALEVEFGLEIEDDASEGLLSPQLIYEYVLSQLES